MLTTHNKIDKAIAAMEEMVDKGQPWAKANKDRRIRETLRWLRIEQKRPIILKKVWFYFQMWLKNKFRSSNKEQEALLGGQDGMQKEL